MFIAFTLTTSPLFIKTSIMSPEEFEKLPIIGLGDTVDNDPTSYSDLQWALMPHIDMYHNILWAAYYGVLIVLITRFIILPMFKRDKKDNKETEAKT